ncbi:C-terminal binding protein AN-like [Phalaenopsis equestris]|uniref:C-terminal binding protein AN-like n=1 Tax=Phalaenopsis equestris TaxID=78828 RepID=UPI0009E514F5|nr:C-terminal binding protein AN-like [Phalaenopsis equestris]
MRRRLLDDDDPRQQQSESGDGQKAAVVERRRQPEGGDCGRMVLAATGGRRPKGRDSDSRRAAMAKRQQWWKGDDNRKVVTVVGWGWVRAGGGGCGTTARRRRPEHLNPLSFFWMNNSLLKDIASSVCFFPLMLTLLGMLVQSSVREMPNVLILPRSADYSEEVWMEIREKAITMLQAFFLDNLIPNNDISDEGEENSAIALEGDQAENSKLQINESKESQVSGPSQNTARRSHRRHSRSSKKAKKRHARQGCPQKSNDFSGVEGSYSSQQEDTAISGMEQSSRFASPDDSKSKQICLFESNMESSSQKPETVGGLKGKCVELLKDGFVIALHTRDRTGFHVSRQRVPGGGWFLDTFSNVTKRDPAAQFLISFKSKDMLGLRSFTAGGKLLQVRFHGYVDDWILDSGASFCTSSHRELMRNYVSGDFGKVNLTDGKTLDVVVMGDIDIALLS